MFYGIFENGLPFVSFGKGNKNLIVIPGLIDIVSSVTTWRWFWPWYFRHFHANFKVYVIGTKKPLTTNCSIESIAQDYATVVNKFPLANFICLDVATYIIFELMKKSSFSNCKIVIYPTFITDKSRVSNLTQMAKQDHWSSAYRQAFSHNVLPVIEKLYHFFPVQKNSSNFVSIMENIQKYNINHIQNTSNIISVYYKSNQPIAVKGVPIQELFFNKDKQNSTIKNIIDDTILYFFANS